MIRWKNTYQIRAALFWWVATAVLLGGAPQVKADALVFSRAMKASTIAEIFVETNLIRVKLEIGLNDVEVFGNLLPDDLYARMNPDGKPHQERLRTFFTEEFVLRPDQSAPLQGSLENLKPRQRVVRDEITGEPLPVAEGQEEVVIEANLLYPLTRLPGSLTFRPPSNEGLNQVSLNLGFVVYHQGLMVNDFRYLSGEETLQLDWEDPWFSKFDNRNIKRQFNEPLSAFLYVDPFEVRKEIVARPRDLQFWVDLGLAGKDTIRAEDQPQLKQKVAEFLAVMNPVTIDGRSIEPVLDRIHFIERTARRTRVIDPPEDLSMLSATLGVIYSYPVTGMPQHVFMEWELFSDRIKNVPGSATDEVGGMPTLLEPDNPVLEWKNFLLKPSRGTLVVVEAPPGPSRVEIPVLSISLVLLALGFACRCWLRRGHGSQRPAMMGVVGLMAGGLLTWPLARIQLDASWKGPPQVTTEQAREVMTGLLKNIYRSFDYREESQIYDVLARSVSGDLLTQTYLETRKALELENQGGARAKVKLVELLETSTQPLDNSTGFSARCTWNVTGTVGHWGHLHQRRNQYEARLTIQPVEGSWKLTGLELLSEQRL